MNGSLSQIVSETVGSTMVDGVVSFSVRISLI